MSESSIAEATKPRRPPFARRSNPDGNERLTAATGIVLVILSLAEIGTLLGGLGHFLRWHVVIGLVLIPPVALKLASTGWRFARYYSRNRAYRDKGAPQLVMRLVAPFLVLATVLLFGSGVAMGFLHGNALQWARRIHGPASVLWLATLGVHVLVYGLRALRVAGSDLMARTRLAVPGVGIRLALVAGAIFAGLVVGVATLPVQHHWLHLHRGDHHGREH